MIRRLPQYHLPELWDRPRLNTPMYHLQELQGRQRAPVQLGRQMNAPVRSSGPIQVEHPEGTRFNRTGGAGTDICSAGLAGQKKSSLREGNVLLEKINEITYAINGAVYEVNRVLGTGFVEKILV